MSRIWPKVTIGVITYNQQDYLGSALDSILAQDYPDFEVIVGDDASTDRTAEVARGYAKRFAGRVSVEEAAHNGGITTNCNRLLEIAKGEIFILLGGDDIMMPGLIKAEVEALMNNPHATLCHTNLEWFDSATGKVLRLQNSPELALDKATSIRRLVQRNYITGTGVAFWLKRMPAEKFNPALGTLSDWLFFIETALLGGVVYVDRVLVRYRIHSNNVSKRRLVMLGDSITTLQLVRHRHAALRWPARQGLATLYAGRAFYLLEQGRAADGLKDLLHGLMMWPLNLRIWVGLPLGWVALTEKVVWRRSDYTQRLVGWLRQRL